MVRIDAILVALAVASARRRRRLPAPGAPPPWRGTGASDPRRRSGRGGCSARAEHLGDARSHRSSPATAFHHAVAARRAGAGRGASNRRKSNVAVTFNHNPLAQAQVADPAAASSSSRTDGFVHSHWSDVRSTCRGPVTTSSRPRASRAMPPCSRVPAARGRIADRHGDILTGEHAACARSRPCPPMPGWSRRRMRELRAPVEMNVGELQRQARRGARLRHLKRQVPPEVAQAVADLRLPGITGKDTVALPGGGVMAHILRLHRSGRSRPGGDRARLRQAPVGPCRLAPGDQGPPRPDRRRTSGDPSATRWRRVALSIDGRSISPGPPCARAMKKQAQGRGVVPRRAHRRGARPGPRRPSAVIAPTSPARNCNRVFHRRLRARLGDETLHRRAFRLEHQRVKLNTPIVPAAAAGDRHRDISDTSATASSP